MSVFLVGVAGIWVTQKAYFSAGSLLAGSDGAQSHVTFYLYQPSGPLSLVYYGLVTRFASVAGRMPWLTYCQFSSTLCYRYQHKQVILNILALVSVALMLV